ncbi:MAG: carboxymuconolactone decarboxylase family protein [Burkholderiales bacterium]|nr:carboxymuconolactone decarboxylase family protein [Burkholderiales bacterium]MBH2017527.1 carboxymuconolactone decarboxylase family protein [Burkholderiales bacterium]
MPPRPYLNTLHAVCAGSATPAQQALLDQARQQVGFIPNMYANMVNEPAVLSTYLHGYSLFRQQSGLSSAEQEVTFLAISRANGCDYCTAAHSMIADRVSKVPPATLAAIRQGHAIPDARLAALHALATEMASTQGRPTTATLAAFLNAGFEERHILHVILATAVKALSNFSNHAFATTLDERFAAHAMPT